MSLYLKHRPTSFDEILGNASAIKALEGKLRAKEVPHAVLFFGPSGCGKTTLARVLKDRLGCGDGDFQEENCAIWEKPLGEIRQIRRRMAYAPTNGVCRVWLLDEVQSLTRAKFAQQALLKMLEDTPAHVYFILCTTDPDKVIAAVKTRCTQIKVDPLKPAVMSELIWAVLEKEGAKLSEDVVDGIIEAADGSAREALVLLDIVYRIEDEDDQLRLVKEKRARQPAVQLCRMLVDGRSQWADIATFVHGCDEDPESLRRMVLGYAAGAMLKNPGPRWVDILEAFRDPFYDIGRPGLVLACWNARPSGWQGAAYEHRSRAGKQGK